MSIEKLNNDEVMFDPDALVACCLCGKEIPWRESCNPWPLVDDEESRCCAVCDSEKVTPARLKRMRTRHLHEDALKMVNNYATAVRIWNNEEENEFEQLSQTAELFEYGFNHLPEDITTTYQDSDRAQWKGFILGVMFARANPDA